MLIRWCKGCRVCPISTSRFLDLRSAAAWLTLRTDPVVVQYDMACGRKKNYVYIVPKCKAGFAICVPVACAIFFFLFLLKSRSWGVMLWHTDTDHDEHSCWGKKRKWATLTRLCQPESLSWGWMCCYVWYTEASACCFAYVIIVPGRKKLLSSVNYRSCWTN